MLDLGRTNDTVSTAELVTQLTELVEMADGSDIEAVYCGEHHAHEFTIAPNPFQLLAYWRHSSAGCVLVPRLSVRRTGIRSNSR